MQLLADTTLIARGARAAGGVRGHGLTAGFDSPRETLDDVADWLLAKGRADGARRRDARRAAFRGGGPRRAVWPPVVVLGPQQFDVLAALVRRPGVVCKPGTLALEAFGYAMPGDATAVRHHVLRIRHTLGAYGARIETVRSVGYRYLAC